MFASSLTVGRAESVIGSDTVRRPIIAERNMSPRLSKTANSTVHGLVRSKGAPRPASSRTPRPTHGWRGRARRHRPSPADAAAAARDGQCRLDRSRLREPPAPGARPRSRTREDGRPRLAETAADALKTVARMPWLVRLTARAYGVAPAVTAEPGDEGARVRLAGVAWRRRGELDAVIAKAPEMAAVEVRHQTRRGSRAARNTPREQQSTPRPHGHGPPPRHSGGGSSSSSADPWRAGLSLPAQHPPLNPAPKTARTKQSSRSGASSGTRRTTAASSAPTPASRRSSRPAPEPPDRKPHKRSHAESPPPSR